MLSIPTSDAAATFEAVRREALDWIARRAGKPLPPEAWRGQTFELEEVGAQRTAAAVLEKPLYWAARADDADKNVAKRTWVSEFGLAIASQSEVRFGCRLQCVSQGDAAPVGRSVPWVVSHIARRYGAMVDGRPVTDIATRASNASETEDLVRLLLDPQRRRPVIAISDSHSAGMGLLDDAQRAGDAVAARTLGLSHVYVISDDASYALTRMLGKEFSVFNGAVRTYRSRFVPDADEPGQHPVAFLDSIRSWPEGGEQAFLEFLVNQVFRQSVAGRDLESELPAFTTVRRVSLKARRESAIARGDSQRDLLALAFEEAESLRKQIDEDRRTHEGLLEAAEDERDEALAALNLARSDNRNLRERVDHLMAALNARGRVEEIPIPESFEELEEWGRRYLAGAVLLTNRALRAARKAEFADPALGYRALLVLRDLYVPMRKGQVSREQYHTALAELGLEDSGTFSGARAGQFGDEYYVSHGGRRRELDRHLKGSNSRDERYGFRLYFFWDEQAEQVVVGWLPTHLTTDIS